MSDQPGGGAPEPNQLTLEAVTELVTKTVNAAITGREKRFTETMGKTLEERFAKFAESLPKPGEPTTEPEGKGGKVDPELVKLRQEMDATKKRLEASEKARAEAETRSRREKATNLLSSALGRHAMPEAVAVLTKAMIGDVVFGDDGEPMLPLPDGSGTSTIDAVVSEWAKSDAAKAFKPAPTAGGSGARSAGKSAPVAIPPGTPVSALSDQQRDALLQSA